MAYYHIGLAYKSLGNYKQSIIHHKISIQRFTDFYGDAPSVTLVTFYKDLGIAYHKNGEYKESIEQHIKVANMGISMKCSEDIIAYHLINLVLPVLELGKQKCKKDYENAEDVTKDEEIVGATLIHIAMTLIKCSKSIILNVSSGERLEHEHNHTLFEPYEKQCREALEKVILDKRYHIAYPEIHIENRLYVTKFLIQALSMIYNPTWSESISYFVSFCNEVRI